MLYAGMDEAGYGPMLGPLCIGATVFEVSGAEAEDGAPDLWKVLRKAVCRSRRDSRRRIAIDDSKKLKGAATGKTHPLRYLERGVLAMCAAAGRLPETDDELFEHLDGSTPTAPWYRSSTSLPLAEDAAQLLIAASRLRRAMDDTGAQCRWISCEVIDADRFNELVGRTGSKATVNFGAFLRLIDAVWSRWPDAHPRVIVDRQGGRTHYREDLQQAFPEAQIRVLAESPAISRYHLERDGAELTVTFLKDAEAGHLPVALASMVAKYTRELYMLRLNRFFQGHLPELKPTAGYFEDARRYLRDIGPLVEQLAIDRPRLVRSV